MEVEDGWKWRMDGSGGWMEVEDGWKWRMDGSGGWMEVDGNGQFVSPFLFGIVPPAISSDNYFPISMPRLSCIPASH
jgi:hypothetical protein